MVSRRKSLTPRSMTSPPYARPEVRPNLKTPCRLSLVNVIRPAYWTLVHGLLVYREVGDNQEQGDESAHGDVLRAPG